MAALPLSNQYSLFIPPRLTASKSSRNLDFQSLQQPNTPLYSTHLSWLSPSLPDSSRGNNWGSFKSFCTADDTSVKKVVQEDSKLLPEFADAEEQELYESLNLMLESDLDAERNRHYEVVYMIHEDFDEEVEKVNLKVQEFLSEKKGRVRRISDWGLRRLAYKIRKAKNAHYMLMNFEMEAKWINEFKSMLDKDERVIRHLVMKQDEAITEECIPAAEFHTLRADMDDNDDDDDEYDDEEEEEDDDDDDVINIDHGDDANVIYVDEDEDEDSGDHGNEKDQKTAIGGRRKLEKAQKVG